ncbi:MAG: iron chelate uptake ABC transporter family permease subunit [Oscillospiraceae bacterium]
MSWTCSPWGTRWPSRLGLSARLARSALLTLAAVLCGAAVSFAGLVGFVGLLVPHAARFLVGTRHRDLLLASMLLGALLVTVCDLLGRVLFAPFELPVGILLLPAGRPLLSVAAVPAERGRRTVMELIAR